MNDLSVIPNMCVNCSICEKSCPTNSMRIVDGIPLFCMNCSPDKASCLKICPTGAIESVGGAILLNKDECIGCGACENACPVGAISVDKFKGATKCNFCINEDTKECVESCPTNALTDNSKEIVDETRLKMAKKIKDII